MNIIALGVLACHFVSAWSIPPSGFWYNEQQLRDQVDRALLVVEGILNTTRHPVLPDMSDNHTYDDKYALVEATTNTAIASYITVLESLGMSSIEEVVRWVQEEHRPVVLRFEMNPRCVFHKREERKVVTSDVEIEKSIGGSGLMARMTSETQNVKVKHTIVEYYWNVTAPYKLSLVSGENEIELLRRAAEDTFAEVKISGGSLARDERPPAPFPSGWKEEQEVPVTWLFENVRLSGTDSGGVEKASTFSIDRLSKTCKTPARNDDVDKAWTFAERLERWSQAVADTFRELEGGISLGLSRRSNLDSGILENVFTPVLPLFEDSKVLSQEDFNSFLKAHKATLDSHLNQALQSFPDSGLMSRSEIKIVELLSHLRSGLVGPWKQSVGMIEALLRSQLIKAIGKVVRSSDFEEYMTFHSHRMLKPGYAPEPFSYSVRNDTTSFPDGLFSIERGTGSRSVPIETTVRRVHSEAGMSPFTIPITAATSVEIRGDRYLHGWLRFQWDGEDAELFGSGADLNLRARAHQFSSYMILIGKIDGPDRFIPKDAIILQNKDEVLVPILTNVLPNSQEFRDAVASLSPEQRAFAEAFRSMQLQSSVFGVCIIQIKPQLEKLMNLPAKALAKEIQLTQDLMTLFVEYQIPSDLLSFDGDDGDPASAKVEAVQGYVKAVKDVIEEAKKAQLEAEAQKAKMKEHREGPTAGPAAGPSTAGPTAGPTKMLYSSAASSQSSTRRLQATMLMATADDMGGAGFSESQQSVPPPQAKNEVNEESGGRFERHHLSSNDSNDPEDFTQIPKLLDRKLLELDQDGALKSTILESGTDWSMSRQENLLESARMTLLFSDDIKAETNKAMDLLTALSRSGSLPILSSELHVIITLTHCFENSVIGAVVTENINPIEKAEQSLLMLASTIQNVPYDQIRLHP